jgi:hypothetical protein
VAGLRKDNIMKTSTRRVPKLKGKPISCIKLELTKEMREELENLKKSDIFQSMLLVSGLHPVKKGDEK